MRVIRALGVIEAIEHFRDQEIEIAISLAMRIGRSVDRHVVDEIGKVGAVVEVETACEILRRLALAGVDGDDKAGHRFQ
jgi:hypothetical protein